MYRYSEWDGPATAIYKQTLSYCDTCDIVNCPSTAW